ncbi:dihydrolipoyl dehydrogenase family protein [Actomonas aquatica]|uniref:NAD(P)/FAD-dependent oxidoreductase n=1 Tax=Actomonas aquatica TaxID=2866162 RepID=A0ABZ1CAR3_9BACT|nr:NAD(P)/FAD-dependent oxidoreductase [Opitutus sp. WL0086]WRQ88475.1 NAD(P)/FAD-dependent oxidoreductase [Opitutus sp. WL0086]
MKRPISYDFIAIGGGSAGFNAARVAADLGKKVAIVDGAEELGGLCILRGCMPSKTLLYSTDVLHLAQHGKLFGLNIPSAKVDMKRLHARKKAIIGEFAEYRAKAMMQKRYDVYRAHAKFIDPHTIALSDGKLLRAERFIIGTGSKVSVPPLPGLADTPFWTSDDVLDLDFVPQSVIVLGGGIVACELSQFLSRIGSRVVQIQRSSHILKEHSPEASIVVEDAFRDEGIDLHTGTSIQSIRTTSDGGVSVTFLNSDGKKLTRRAKHLFNALGRSPNTGSLDLANAGVELQKSGRIKINQWQQTTQRHIYAGGDCCGPHDIVHLAVAQGELAARHAFGEKKLKPVDENLLLSVVFTEPPIASIGRSEAQLKAEGTPFLTASYPFDDHGKSILMEAKRGYVKVIAEPKRGRILGAEIVGPQAGELIHCFTAPLAMKATVFDLLKAPWYHPTLAEILTYPLEDIADEINGDA